MNGKSDGEPTCCPFINQGDPRCGRLFTLKRLGEAFELCVNNFTACETHAILQRQRDASVTVTVGGCAPGARGVRRAAS